MSEVQRLQKLSSDFSIARILGDDRTGLLTPKPVTDVREGRRIPGPVSVEPSVRKKDREDRNRLQPLGVLGYPVGRYNFDAPEEDAASTVADGRGGWLSCSLREENLGSVQPLRITEHPGVAEGSSGVDSESGHARSSADNELAWLRCTRYKPPRLPRRSSAGRSLKRRPGKHPRIPFTAFQLQVLEDKYRMGAYLARRDVLQLSTVLRLPQSRVKIWFQNRRARDRRESLKPHGVSTVSSTTVSKHQQEQTTEEYGQSVVQSATECIDRALSLPIRDQQSPGSS